MKPRIVQHSSAILQNQLIRSNITRLQGRSLKTKRKTYYKPQDVCKSLNYNISHKTCFGQTLEQVSLLFLSLNDLITQTDSAMFTEHLDTWAQFCCKIWGGQLDVKPR